MMLRKLLLALSAVLLVGTTAACGDDDDDNGNGSTEVDCKDPANADHPDCKTPPVVETPFCELPENVDKPECKRDFKRDELVYSYVNGLALPAEGEECCWDYMAGNNNDPDDYNNSLGPILDLVGDFAEDINVGELLDDLFRDGDLTLIFEYTDFPALVPDSTDDIQPGAFDLALHIGEIEVDADNDNLPTVSADDRLAGKGRFILGDQLAEIKNAFIRRNVIYADTDKLNLSLDLEAIVEGDALDGIGLPNPLELPLSAVRLRFDVEEQRDGEDLLGIKTKTDAQGDLITDDQGKSINFLSGVIEGQPLVELLNPVLVGLCDLDAGAQAVIFDGTKSGDPNLEPDPSAPVPPLLTMDEDVVAQMAASSDSVCSMIGGLGDALGGILGGFFDVDTNRNGVTNGISLGLNLGFVGVEEIVAAE